MFISGVAIKGYQSLYDVKLQLGNFTVIYGESDVGKSALFRAIRGLVEAESGDEFISKGLKSAVVALQTGSGAKIAWVKKEGKSSEYTAKMDKDTPLRVWKRNRKLPPDLAKLLRFGELTVDGDKIYPNFRGQFDSLYLVFDSSGRRAKVIGSLVSGILLRVLKQANLERIRVDADTRATSSLIEDLEDKESFDWDELLIKIAIEAKVVAKIRRAKDLVEQIEILVNDKESLERCLTVDAEYLPAEVFTELEALIEIHTELKMMIALQESGFQARDSLLTELNKVNKDIEKADLDMAALEEKMTFPCPHCGKAISKLEVGYE